MNKTKIEWCDYTWNPVKGLCPTGCWYCYARAFYKRFKWDQTIRFDEETYTKFLEHSKSLSGRIFVGSTIDLFHPEVLRKIKSFGIERILAGCDCFPNATFIFLTKFPARYAEFDFPKNCWLGVTITSKEDSWKFKELGLRSNNNLRFISYEPILGVVALPLWVEWVIVGALTGPKRHQFQPPKDQIRFLVDMCKSYEIPVFLKDNLKKVWGKKLIQEFPE